MMPQGLKNDARSFHNEAQGLQNEDLRPTELDPKDSKGGLGAKHQKEHLKHWKLLPGMIQMSMTK